MAPIKFEEQLKDKLEQRRIQPSSDAWKQLNNKLDASESKQNNKGFWMLGIAATIVGVLLALTFVFKSNTKIVEPTIVDTNIDTIIEKQDLKNLEENNTVATEQSKKQPEEAQQKETKEQMVKSPLKSAVKEQQEALISNKHNEGVANVTIKSIQEETDKKPIDVQLGIVSFEDQKVNDVVAQIQKLQQENKAVSNEEIETLLAAAQKEITMQKLYDEATNTVDANALLQSVEDDLEQSFRDKVFSAIKSGYETVKTAVAERNN